MSSSIARFLKQKRVLREQFEHEASYQFDDASELIRRFPLIHERAVCVEFHPAYTSRASPEIVKIDGTYGVIWDYHLLEFIESTRSNLVGRQLLREVQLPEGFALSENDLTHNFVASLLRFLTTQTFRSNPHLSLALGNRYVEASRNIRVPVSRDRHSLLESAKHVLWMYILHHELCHVLYDTLDESERLAELSSLQRNFAALRVIHGQVRQHQPEWEREHLAFYQQLDALDEGQIGPGLAEELTCDSISFRVTVATLAEANGIAFEEQPDKFRELVSLTAIAANQMNNIRLHLSALSNFWDRVARELREGRAPNTGLITEALQQELQSNYFRGIYNTDIAPYLELARALGHDTFDPLDKGVSELVEQQRQARNRGEGYEGLDEWLQQRLGEAMTDGLSYLTSQDLVVSIAGQARHHGESMDAEEALRAARDQVGW